MNQCPLGRHYTIVKCEADNGDTHANDNRLYVIPDDNMEYPEAGFRITWNTDFLAVAGFAALGLVLMLDFMLGS